MFYHLRDPDGREWGPFTTGQLTTMRNLEMLNGQWLIRADGDTTWHASQANLRPKNIFKEPADPDGEGKRAAGERALRELQLVTARRRLAAAQGSLTIPPTWFSVDFAEEIGWICAGPVGPSVFEGGLALAFGDGQHVRAELYLSPRDYTLLGWMTDEKRMFAEMERITQQARQHLRSSEQAKAVYAPIAWLETKGRAGLLRHAFLASEYLGARGDQMLEYFTVSIAAQRLLHVRFSYPLYLGSLVSRRVTKFVELACDAFS